MDKKFLKDIENECRSILDVLVLDFADESKLAEYVHRNHPLQVSVIMKMYRGEDYKKDLIKLKEKVNAGLTNT